MLRDLTLQINYITDVLITANICKVINWQE